MICESEQLPVSPVYLVIRAWPAAATDLEPLELATDESQARAVLDKHCAERGGVVGNDFGRLDLADGSTAYMAQTRLHTTQGRPAGTDDI